MTKLQEILTWLSDPKDFMRGAELYEKYGSNVFLKKRFAMGENPYNKQLLIEELKQLAISFEKEELKAVKRKSIVKTATKGEAKKLPPKRSSFQARLNEMNSKKERDNKQTIEVEHYKTASQYTGLSQTEFAMLPKELKEIAVENVKLYNNACKQFRLLSRRNAGKVIEHLSPEEIEDNALQCEIIVESMRINQLGWDEIRFWQRYKRFKREHPYFKKVDIIAELKSLSRAELLLRKKNRQSNLSNYKKKLEVSTDEKQTMKIKAKIDAWHIEIEAINKLLEAKK